MSLLIFCIILLLIASVLGLLIDYTGVAKLGIFMTSVCIMVNQEFSVSFLLVEQSDD